jgi:hypothetical protein
MSTYSTNLGIELIATGDQSGTWGTTTNSNLGTLLEQAIAGYSTQAVTDSPLATVLTIVDGTSSTGRNAVISLTGAITAARTVEIPAKTKTYVFSNDTTGGYAVTVKVNGQTGFSIANGTKSLVYCNGTDAVEVVNSSPTSTVTLTGTQTLTNKRVTPRQIATTTTTSPFAINTDSYDQYSFTALANALTISLDGGTPTDGQKLVLRILNNGTGYVITFTGSNSNTKFFRPVGVSLTASSTNWTYTLTASKITYFGMIYNSNATCWDIVAITTQA